MIMKINFDVINKSKERLSEKEIRIHVIIEMVKRELFNDDEKEFQEFIKWYLSRNKVKK